MNAPAIHFADGISPEQQKRLLTSHRPFQEWMEGATRLGAARFDVHKVNFFGLRPGFVYAEASVPDASGDFHPNLTFVRGDAVAILVVLHPDFRGDFVAAAKSILVHQMHVAIGKKDCATIPAGMLDGGDDYVQKARQEVLEETGIHADGAHFIDLGRYYVSSGGCDEAMQLYAAEITMPQEQIDALHGRKAGLKEERENITVEVCPLRQVGARSGADGIHDMKTQLALQLYLKHLQPR